MPLATLLVLLAAPPVRAWPVDLAVNLEAGKERFHKLTVVDWVEVEDPSIATAEIFQESKELMLTGVKPGRTLLLLYAEGKFAVWRLVVARRASRSGRGAQGLSGPEGHRERRVLVDGGGEGRALPRGAARGVEGTPSPPTP